MTGAAPSELDALGAGANRSGRWFAGATTLLAVAVDLVFGAEASLIVPLVFGPFVASALASVRDTVVVACAATVLAVLLGWPDGTLGSSAHAVRAASVAIGGCLAVWLAAQRVSREARLRALRRVAEVAQDAILHPLASELGGVRMAARYISASEEARIGGDFYDAVLTKWGVRIMVGDVRGKGLEAVRLAAALIGEFRSRALSEPELTAVAAAVDAAGSRIGEQAGEDFATAVFMQMEDEVATIVRCGHPLPLLADGDRVQPIDTRPSLPLCLGTDGIAEQVPVPAGSRILLYSDGAVEARNGDGQWFDLEASFTGHVQHSELANVLDAVLADLDTHCDGAIGDDVVFLLLEQPHAGQTVHTAGSSGAAMPNGHARAGRPPRAD